MEALLSAEQGRAQALSDLIELKYTSKQYPAESDTEIQTIAKLSGFPSTAVFFALEHQEVIFWVLQKGRNVQLRRKQIPERQVDADTFLDTTRKKIRGRAVVQCEDRSLNMTRDENFANESSPPDKRQNQQSFNLPDNAKVKVKMIGRILHTTPLIGEQATKNEVLERLSSVALVHIDGNRRNCFGTKSFTGITDSCLQRFRFNNERCTECSDASKTGCVELLS